MVVSKTKGECSIHSGPVILCIAQLAEPPAHNRARDGSSPSAKSVVADHQDSIRRKAMLFVIVKEQKERKERCEKERLFSCRKRL